MDRRSLTNGLQYEAIITQGLGHHQRSLGVSIFVTRTPLSQAWCLPEMILDLNGIVRVMESENSLKDYRVSEQTFGDRRQTRSGRLLLFSLISTHRA